jgi:hypothetical protein
LYTVIPTRMSWRGSRWRQLMQQQSNHPCGRRDYGHCLLQRGVASVETRTTLNPNDIRRQDKICTKMYLAIPQFSGFIFGYMVVAGGHGRPRHNPQLASTGAQPPHPRIYSHVYDSQVSACFSARFKNPAPP